MTVNTLATALMAFAVVIAGPAGQTGTPQETDILRGTVDIHVHSDPDKDRVGGRPRSRQAGARQGHARRRAKESLRSNRRPRVSRAQGDTGTRSVGGIDLNLTVGGMNAIAVEHMTQVAGRWGRLVWMSTFDAENQVRFSKENRPFVSVSRNGELLPETKAVIAAITKHNLVMATGHVSAPEALLLLREGHRQGTEHMVVTHAMNPPVSMDVAQMQEAAKEGAFIEFVGGSLTAGDANPRLDRYADAIRKVGPQFCILSSDLGQKSNALPVDGYAAFLQAMRARGFSEHDVNVMSKDNPAKLLGLR